MPLINFSPVPVYQWTQSEFLGRDPWLKDQPVQWSVVVYRIVGESFVHQIPVTPRPNCPDRSLIPANCVVGIYAAEHNRYRILPLALQDLWRAGKVRDESLPQLLHKIEASLLLTDYPPGQMARTMGIYSLMFPIVAALAFMGGLYGTAGFLLIAAVACLGIYRYWRQRRQRFAALWLTM